MSDYDDDGYYYNYYEYEFYAEFHGLSRTLAGIQLLLISIISILLQIVFILGIRRLCGWGSNFAFTILLFISLCAIQQLFMEIVAVSLSLFYLELSKYMNLWRICGSMKAAIQNSSVIFHILLVIHRINYTLFPLKARYILKRWLLKFFLVLIILITLGNVALCQTELMGMVFIPSMMQWTFTIHEYSGVLYGMNRTSNYVVAIINVVIYPILFIVLYFKKNISLNNTKEIKMTVQVFAMVFLELLFFSFWEFVPEINNLWIFLLIENSNLIYFDMLILPYLVLNRNIHFELRRYVMKPPKILNVSSIKFQES